MKALSLWQPWSAAVARGAKKIETRNWSTGYRGPLLIHAARTKVGLEVARPMSAIWRDVLRVPPNQSLEAMLRELPFGAVLARCELFDCVPAGDTEAIRDAARRSGERYSPYERELGDYRRGRWAWLLRNVEALPEPIPARGRQSLFDIDLHGAERAASSRSA